MGILRFDTQCINCILNKFLGKVPSSTDEKIKLSFAKQLLKIIADADNCVSAPEIVAAATALKNKFFGFTDDFAEIKTHFNRLMLSKESEVAEKTAASHDPLKTAVQFAMLGNYIDFGAMDSVNEDLLSKLLTDAENIALDEQEYNNFITDLKTAKQLVYLTDNCGEVVLDKLLIKQIKQHFPSLMVTVLVRGEAVLNDATHEDAVAVGLTDIATVMSNGTNIAGTCLERLSQEAKTTVENADIIISKGQGNFETLHDCGLNVYYLFLCKCSLFSERFKVPKLTGMFLNDRRMSKSLRR